MRDWPADPAALLRLLRAQRRDVIEVMKGIGYGCPVSTGLHGITEAIDRMAGILTGQEEFLGAQQFRHGGGDRELGKMEAR